MSSGGCYEPRPADIAVIGMAVRVPGARNLDVFRENLWAGREAITFFTDEELRTAGVNAARLADCRYVKANAVLPDADRFDAAFFGYTPREAELLDVQQRVFLECAWTALEHAGYDPLAMPKAVGVFAGAGLNTYLLRQIAHNPAALASAGGFQVLIANDKDFLATRVSYKLNLRGPSVAVQSACSTSLVAVHLAVQSLLAGDCEAALAGGVSIRVPQTEGYTWQEGMILSPDGHCRPFDSKAAGTIGGNGAGAVLLKRAEDALADGDTIHALIRGSAINNDGAGKMGYTAPSMEGQEAVITEALAVGGVAPDEIGYIEAHGTGTPLGDPIEVAALTRAFRRTTQRRQFCALGSVKSNLGHLDAAAGVVGLVKAVLVVRDGEIPPSLHFETPNPQIDFANSPFRVAAKLEHWSPEPGRRRLAGVSSFGIGGTNAHVVLEQPPEVERTTPPTKEELLVVSARSATELAALQETLAGQLERSEFPLGDIAHTLAAGRHAFAHRSCVVAATAAEAAAQLRRSRGKASAERTPAVAFLFPGQGTQFPGMMAGLLAAEPVFRSELDRCAELLRPHVAFDLKALLLDASTDPRLLARTDVAQPVLFATSFALARWWISCGVQPQAMLGHSIGEWVAACLAGVFTVEDALRMVAARGRLMAAQPTGMMLAVGLDETETRTLITSDLDIAAVNAAGQTVVSGPEPAIAALAAMLDARGVAGTRLNTSHAYHSAMMEPAAQALARELRAVTLHEPSARWVSNVTGDWITSADATSPEYWARHLRSTVRFRDGLATLLGAAKEQVLIEVGAGRTLTGLVERHAARQSGHVAIASGRGARDKSSDRVVLRQALGTAWAAGVAIDWSQLFAGTGARRVPLATYPFAGERYWIEAVDGAAAQGGVDRSQKRPDVADWFHVPGWLRGALPRASGEISEGEWAIVPDKTGVAEALAGRLREAGAKVRVADNPADVVRAPVPRWIVSLRDVGPTNGEKGFQALCELGAALSGVDLAADTRLTIVVSGLHAFAGEQAVDPTKALLLGPARVLPNEVAGLRCKVVDVAAPSGASNGLVAGLLAEARSGNEDCVAWRGHERWVRTVTPTRIEAPATFPWRERGVYLITGGCGGIGLVIADSLARRFRARLILIGRTAPDEATQRRIAEMVAAGAEVEVAQADVTDEAQMIRVRDAGKRHFGSIHGVIHAAGVAGGGALARRTPAERAAVLAPKVQGTQVLERVFGAGQLDFMLLMSSLTAELGEFGQAEYAAANAYLDAFAAERRSVGRPVTAIAWDAWRDVGMASRVNAPGALAEWIGRQRDRRITNDEGLAVLARAASAGDAQLIVSTVELAVRRREQVEARQAATWSAGAKPDASERGTAAAVHPRPELAVAFAAPVGASQRQIAAVWQELLGISPVGVNDNFFDLGGHSLLASQAVARLREAGCVGLTLASFFETPTVAGLAAKLANVSAEEPKLVAVSRDRPLPLSFAQQALWLVDRMDGGSAHYNEFGAQRIRGSLDAARLSRALSLIVVRHEVLRTRFEQSGDEIMQRIEPAKPVDVECRDATEAELAKHAAELSAMPFALDGGALLRARLLRVGPEDHVLMVVVHHIVFDGWSSSVYFREAIATYAALASGRSPELPALTVQYADFAAWQRQWLTGRRRNDAVDFWREQLGGKLPVLNLPTDRPRPVRQGFRGARLAVEIDLPLTRELERRGRERSASLFMMLLAGYAALLGRVAGQEEVIVGCPIAGRDRKELEPLIGLFINPLPIRVSLAGGPTLGELVERVRAAVVAAYARAALPFELMVEAVKPPRDPSRSPVFQAILTFQNAMAEPPRAVGLTVEPWTPPEAPARSDLDWYGWETDRGVSGHFIYNRDLFDATTVERWCARLQTLLTTLASAPETRLADVRFETAALPGLRRARPAVATTPS